jgi:TolB-like protein
LAYLANGLSEEILNQLAQLPDLVVIARTSSFAFRSEGADIATIGNRLNVAHVLEGSLRAQGSEVRVTAQLIDTASQAHIWSNVYERPLDDIFDLQLEIAAGVARELKGVLLTGDESRRSGAHIPHPDAYKAVLEGQTLYQRRMDGDLERARALFEKATELDPDYALAWTRLSAVIFLLFNRGDLSLDEALALGAPAARHAIELEPDLAEAQFRAGWFTSLSGDRENGRAMVERSFELEPHSPRTLAARAGRALFRGDALAALELQRKAVSLDPLSAGERLRLCGHLYHAGAFDEYWNELEVALRLNPAAEESTLQAQVAIQLLDGDWERASQRVDLVPEDMERHALRVMLGGFESQGTEASTEAEESSRWLTAQDSFVASIRLAEAWSFRGDTERAFGFLDEARTRILNRAPDELLTPNLQLTRLSHFLEPLHSDPRWSQWLDFIAGVLD